MSKCLVACRHLLSNSGHEQDAIAVAGQSCMLGTVGAEVKIVLLHVPRLPRIRLQQRLTGSG
jgi:hypothetical protein